MELNVKTADQVQSLVKELVGDLLEQDRQSRERDGLAQAINRLADQAAQPVPLDKEQRGLRAGRFLRAIGAGKTPDGAARFARKNWGDEAMAKALEASDAEAGGVLVPSEYSADVIELLRERAVIRSLGPTIIPMPTGSMTMPKLTGGATGGYIGESQNITADEQTFGQISLSWKKLAVLVPMSNDLLRFNVANADGIVRDDCVSSLALTEDAAFLRANGTEFQPKGLYHWAGNKFDAQATPDLTKVTQDLAQAILYLREANVRMLRPAWIMSPRTEFYLMTIRDTNGNLVFYNEMSAGRLFGFPFASTTTVPDNLGTGTDESEVYLVDFADVLIGEANTLEVTSSDVATYHDGSSLQSAFSLDQTVLKLLAHHDLGVRHEDSVCVIEAVAWTW
jgi:HK97 family phage major capsid protein